MQFDGYNLRILQSTLRLGARLANSNRKNGSKIITMLQFFKKFCFIPYNAGLDPAQYIIYYNFVPFHLVCKNRLPLSNCCAYRGKIESVLRVEDRGEQKVKGKENRVET